MANYAENLTAALEQANGWPAPKIDMQWEQDAVHPTDDDFLIIAHFCEMNGATALDIWPFTEHTQSCFGCYAQLIGTLEIFKREATGELPTYQEGMTPPDSQPDQN